MARYPVTLDAPMFADDVIVHESFPRVSNGGAYVVDNGMVGVPGVPPPRVLREYVGERREVGRHVLPDSGARRVVSVTEYFIDEHGNRTGGYESRDPAFWSVGGGEPIVVAGDQGIYSSPVRYPSGVEYVGERLPHYGQHYGHALPQYEQHYPTHSGPQYVQQYPVHHTSIQHSPSRHGYQTQGAHTVGKDGSRKQAPGSVTKKAGTKQGPGTKGKSATKDAKGSKAWK
jgi:hypothetical protein